MLLDTSYAVPGRAPNVPRDGLRRIQRRQSQDVRAVGACRYRDVQCPQ